MSPNFVKLIVPINIKNIRNRIGIDLGSSMPIEDGLIYASKADFRFLICVLVMPQIKDI